MDTNLQEKMKSQRRFYCYLFRIIGILMAVCVFCVLCNMFNRMYYGEDFWVRCLWHDFYEDKGKIENLYLGSSHVFCDIDPVLLDNINGQYNFNLASPLQPLDGTYYLLKEADRKNKLSRVYVELYYVCSTKDNFNLDQDPIDYRQEKNWVNNGYMEFSANRLKYLLSTMKAEKYVDACFPFVRYREHLDDWDFIKVTLGDKADYIDYRHKEKYGNDYKNYREKGQQYSVKVLTDMERCIEQERILRKDSLGEKSKEYLMKIINYCKKRDISLVLYISPMDELQLISVENYDYYIDQIREIALEHDVEFYDFNLAKEEYLPIHQNQYYKDMGHLNSEGATVFTSFFAQVMAGNLLENKMYFYSSYQEKLQSLSPAVYGLYYREMEKEQIKTLQIASNRESGLEYRVILTPCEGEQYMLQDFSENKKFTISVQEHGICTIVVRIKDSGEVIQTLETGY